LEAVDVVGVDGNKEGVDGVGGVGDLGVVCCGVGTVQRDGKVTASAMLAASAATGCLRQIVGITWGVCKDNQPVKNKEEVTVSPTVGGRMESQLWGE
jgi:hypothetical protein